MKREMGIIQIQKTEVAEHCKMSLKDLAFGKFFEFEKELYLKGLDNRNNDACDVEKITQNKCIIFTLSWDTIVYAVDINITYSLVLERFHRGEA